MRKNIFACVLLGSLSAVCAGADVQEIFPAAPWRSHRSAVIIPPADMKYPNTISVGRSGPEPMVVTIAGTAQEPIPYGVGGTTLRLNYSDGDFGWGYRTAMDFSKGGRQEAKLTVLSSREINNVYAYYSAPKGVKLEPPKFEFFRPGGNALLDGVPVMAAKKFEKASFLVRDVKAESGYSRLADGVAAKGLSFTQKSENRSGVRFLSGRIEDVTKQDRAVTLLYAVPLPAKGKITWWDDPRRSREADPSKLTELENTWGEQCGRGPHSRWPIGAVAVDGRGIAIGIDPMKPAYYRIALNPKLRILYIAYDLGLASPERNYADLSLCVFGFKAEEGFRGAFEKYRTLYPEAFADRVKRHGGWVPFKALSKIPGGNVDDFHIRFNEYMWDTDFDDEHQILSLRYKEPCTWWMKLKNEAGGLPSYAECLAFAQAELKRGLPDAQAWATSVFKDSFGRPAGMILDKPWCFGIAWSMNAAPGIAGEMTEYKLKQSEKDFQGNYSGNEYPKGRDGEYVDSVELACTVAADYDRNHFAAMKAPLTFSLDEYRPVVFKGLSVWDYCYDLSRRLRERNRIMFANSTPNHWSYLTPLMDAVGIEISWNDGGKWKCDPPEQLLLWRSIAGDKSFCFLMTNDERFTREMTEAFMKVSLAYGLFPGFQCNYFFDGGNRHNRDRDLWKKYMPLIRRLSESGWRAVNRLAKCEGDGVVMEQFGEKYLTLYNHGKGCADVKMEFLVPVTGARELIENAEVAVQKGKAKFQLEPDDVMMLELNLR